MYATGVVFRNRAQAGRQLAERLAPFGGPGTLVLALPRGGVPIGYEIALALGAPMDTLVARKIGAPFHPEFGIGAIAPGDVLILDNASIRLMGIGRELLDAVIREEMEEMERRMAVYRSGAYQAGKGVSTVIVVDDGLATGVTARAAIESVRLIEQPERIIFAAPVCADDAANRLRREADAVECIYELDHLRAIGYWYEDFHQVSDAEVVGYLERANAEIVAA